MRLKAYPAFSRIRQSVAIPSLPSAGIEPTQPAPEAGALSTELRGRAATILPHACAVAQGGIPVICRMSCQRAEHAGTTCGEYRISSTLPLAQFGL